MSLDEFFLSEEDELIDGNYMCNEQAKREYIEGATALTMLAMQGKCSIELNDPEKPYFLHAIWIVWNVEEIDQELSARQMADIIGKFRVLSVDDGNKWMLTKIIYTKEKQ